MCVVEAEILVAVGDASVLDANVFAVSSEIKIVIYSMVIKIQVSDAVVIIIDAVMFSAG